MKPFDLEAAKRGESLVLRDGRKVRFVAHIPEAHAFHRVIVVTESGAILAYNDINGMARLDCVEADADLFMAPLPMCSINGHEYPEPVREPLEIGQEFFVVNRLGMDFYSVCEWSGSIFDYLWLKRGLIQLTQEGAIAQARATILAGGGEFLS